MTQGTFIGMSAFESSVIKLTWGEREKWVEEN
jgi:hypothetical protein